MEADFIDIAQMSELTGISRNTLAQLRFRGDGPAFYKITSRTIRYRRSEVIAWMESKRAQRTDDVAIAQ